MMVWWAKWQNEATFLPTMYRYYRVIPFQSCKADLVNFYIRQRSRGQYKYVATNRGAHLRYNDGINPNLVHVCYQFDEDLSFFQDYEIKKYVMSMIANFLWCLKNYGTGLSARLQD